MGLSLLQISLLACITYNVFSSEVDRRDDGDRILLNKCIKSCSVYNATCVEGRTKCCKECKCSSKSRKTYYRNSSTQSCVQPNTVEGCKYHLTPRSRDWINIQPGGTKRKDLLLYHREVKLFSYTCSLLKQQYWNLVQWKDFETNYFALDKDTDYKIKVPVKNTSYFHGHLIKLQIKCKSNDDVQESCIIFKILGSRKYETSTMQPVVISTTTTQRPTTTTLPSKVKKKTTSIIIIVIIAVTTLILIALGIFVLWWCWKKRRKAGGHGENTLLNHGDPNYQNTDHFSVRHSSEIHNSANNLTYLQPVDAGVPYSSSKKSKDKNGKKKKKKDHNYDYPDVHSLSQKSAGYQRPRDDISNEKPIYAEVGDIKPNPDYTDPDIIIKPRTGTAVVGVPGYQPFRGPHADDNKSEYSSLGVLSSEDNSVYQALLDDPAKPKPPTPQYAVVEADERKAVENTDDDDDVGDIII